MQLPDFLDQQPAGAIRLTGHRIGLEHVVYVYNQGYTPEMILGQFPSLSLALIHKLIAFYLEHRAEVDEYAAHCQAEVNSQRGGATSSPDLAELRRRAVQLSQSAAP
ncbi:MAG: DUF433 domain-containing protein [Planctomycetales bacterium]